MNLSVCHVQFARYPGQGTTAIYEYTQNLAKMGVDVSVIAVGVDGEPYFEEINGVKVYRVLFGNKQRSLNSLLAYAIKANRQLNSIIKEEKMDIVHQYYTMGCKLLSRPCKTVLDVRSVPITHRLLSGYTGQFYTSFRRKLLENESVGYDLIFVPEFKIGMKLFDYKQGICELPLGANYDLFYPGNEREIRKMLGLENKKVITYTGAIYPQRRLDILLNGLKSILSEDAYLMLVGGGPYLNRLIDIACKLNIRENVIFTGFISYVDVPRYLRASDLAISFVPRSEDFNYQPPVKTMEYLASGLPTIATSTYSHRKVIKDGKNGILVNDDAESVYEGVLRLLESRSLFKKIKMNSRESVSNYSWSEIVRRRLIPAYEKILE